MTSRSKLSLRDLDARVGRRDALRIGGLTLSLGAIVAACGSDRDGDTDPGRVGNAPPATALPDYEVNDAVLLRTASSLELTAVYVYETAKGLGVFEGATATLVDRLIADHTEVAAVMGGLTEAAGGEAWTTTNPWIMDRAIGPILAAVVDSDDPARDVISVAITLENLASATHQTLSVLLTESGQRMAVMAAAAEEARHAATLVLDSFGIANRFTPSLVGEEVTKTADNTLRQYAINATFGSVGQLELVVGKADENGTRTTFLLATPAANSFIYEEYDQS